MTSNPDNESSAGISPDDSTSTCTLSTCTLARRLAAMSYDGLLLIAIWMLAAALIVIPLGHAPEGMAFQLYLLVVAWVYFAICWRRGQTLGMRAWRVRILPERGSMTWSMTAVRFIVALAGLLSFGLGLWWSLFHPRRATWQDLASGSTLWVEPRPGGRTSG